MMAKENDGDDVSWQRRYAENSTITSEVVGGRAIVWGGREEGGRRWEEGEKEEEV